MVRPGQYLVLEGCFSGSSQGECSAWLVQATEVSLIPEPAPQYQSNAEEADARIWRHAKQSTANDILISSPDTDIYNINWIGLATYMYIKATHHSVKCAEITEQRYLYISIHFIQHSRMTLTLPRLQQHIAPTLQSLS